MTRLVTGVENSERTADVFPLRVFYSVPSRHIDLFHHGTSEVWAQKIRQLSGADSAFRVFSSEAIHAII